jgi:cation transport regulator ChaB
MKSKPHVSGIPIGRSLPKRTCYWRYLKYVLRHKWYVLLECRRLNMFWTGIVHDLSKFSIAEWKAYAEWFQSDQGHKFNGGFAWECSAHERMKEAFNKAWEHHWKNNPHHWEYWVVGMQREELPPNCYMPENVAKEMYADWVGANKAQGGKGVIDWYEKNKDRMSIHQLTRNYMESKLIYTQDNLLSKAYNDGISDYKDRKPFRANYSEDEELNTLYADAYLAEESAIND